jgi:integrase
MSVRKIKNHGNWVWQARVAYQGLRKAAFRASKEEARAAEADLLRELKERVGQAEQEGQQPATLRQLFTFYLADLEARGKGPETIGRATQTRTAIERLLPLLLDTPVSMIRDRDLYDVRQARARDGAKPSTINRDLRTLRAMLKAARPDFRFPGGAFFPEDETRVRWLRPEEELLVLEPMPSPFREMAKLAALTLMRQGELRSLRREHVHLEQGVVMLPRAKAGARPVILSAEAQKILRGQLERHPDAGGCSRALTACPTAAFTSAGCFGKPPGEPASAISTFTICATTGPPWRSTKDSRRRSSRRSAAGRPSA